MDNSFPIVLATALRDQASTPVGRLAKPRECLAVVYSQQRRSRFFLALQLEIDKADYIWTSLIISTLALSVHTYIHTFHEHIAARMHRTHHNIYNSSGLRLYHS